MTPVNSSAAPLVPLDLEGLDIWLVVRGTGR